MILFAPDKKSNYCKTEVEKCVEKVWKAELNPGVYKITLTYGDTNAASKYDIMIND